MYCTYVMQIVQIFMSSVLYKVALLLSLTRNGRHADEMSKMSHNCFKRCQNYVFPLESKYEMHVVQTCLESVLILKNVFILC